MNKVINYQNNIYNYLTSTNHLQEMGLQWPLHGLSPFFPWYQLHKKPPEMPLQTPRLSYLAFAPIPYDMPLYTHAMLT